MRAPAIFLWFAACGGGHGGSDTAADAGPSDAGDAGPECDRDRDGHEAIACGGDDCDDGDGAVHPGVVEDEDFRIDVVDDTGTAVEQVALAVGPDGAPHAAYQRTQGDATVVLAHAADPGSGFSIETIDSISSAGAWPSIAVDADGDVVVSFFAGALRVASNDSGAWDPETVDGGGGEYTSLTLDADGNAHVSYRGITAGPDAELRYATDARGDWDVEVVDTQGWTGGGTSIGLDSTGGVHVAYVEANDADDLRYAHRAGGVWTTETVDSNGEMSWGISLAIADDAPHVVYWENLTHDLRHATPDGAAWAIESVDPTHWAYWDVSLAAAPDATLAASFQQIPATTLWITTRGDDGWTSEQFDDRADRGRWSAVAFALDGTIHVTYTDELAGDLLHARRSPRNGIDEDCDTVPW